MMTDLLDDLLAEQRDLVLTTLAVDGPVDTRPSVEPVPAFLLDLDDEPIRSAKLDTISQVTTPSVALSSPTAMGERANARPTRRRFLPGRILSSPCFIAVLPVHGLS